MLAMISVKTLRAFVAFIHLCTLVIGIYLFSDSSAIKLLLRNAGFPEIAVDIYLPYVCITLALVGLAGAIFNLARLSFWVTLLSIAVYLLVGISTIMVNQSVTLSTLTLVIGGACSYCSIQLAQEF